jgi:hypothetical protein
VEDRLCGREGVAGSASCNSWTEEMTVGGYTKRLGFVVWDSPENLLVRLTRSMNGAIKAYRRSDLRDPPKLVRARQKYLKRLSTKIHTTKTMAYYVAREQNDKFIKKQMKPYFWDEF